MNAPDPHLLHAPLITYDGDVDATIGCLSAYAKAWPGCPLLFVIPINAARTRVSVEDAVRGLRLAFVECARDVSSTLDALLRFCAGGGDWIYLCNSDRYPLSFPGLEVLTSLTEHLATGVPVAAVPPGVNAIKLFRWQEKMASDNHPCTCFGHQFSLIDTQGNGFYHHHFIRKSLLASLWGGRRDFTDIYSFHEYLLRHPDAWYGDTLSPDSPIAKFGEVTVGGKFTLNFAVSMGAERSATWNVEAWTKVFTSSVTPAANRFWLEQGIASQDVLRERAPVARALVASFGLTCLDGLEGPAGEADLVATHRRFPFPDLPESQQAFYIFEDPRETILAVFDACRSGRRSMSSHCKRAQISVPTTELDWDIGQFLAGGADLFRLEEHFDFWLYGARPYKVTFVRRRALAALDESRARTAEPVGLRFGLIGPEPALYERTAEALRRRLDEIYGPFARRLATLPDVFSA